MNVLIQARMSSRRLPGKVLTKINNIPLLLYIIERVQLSNLVSSVIVLTSDDISDKPIINFCKQNKINYFTGTLKNVAYRFLQCIKKNNIPYFARLCADSPLIDCSILDRGIKIFNENNHDIVTNVFPRTFPKGQSVEIVKSDVLIETYKKFSKKQHFEHVTNYFYSNSEAYDIYNFSNDMSLKNIRMVVDTYQDLSFFSKIIENLKHHHTRYNMSSILEIIDREKIQCIE